MLFKEKKIQLGNNSVNMGAREKLCLSFLCADETQVARKAYRVTLNIDG